LRRVPPTVSLSLRRLTPRRRFTLLNDSITPSRAAFSAPGTAIINQGDKGWFEVRLERAVSSFVPNEFDFLLEPAVSA
jgi:hypothetical protein